MIDSRGIYLFDKYLLNAYFVPGLIVGSGAAVDKKIDMVLTLTEFAAWLGELKQFTMLFGVTIYIGWSASIQSGAVSPRLGTGKPL